MAGKEEAARLAALDLAVIITGELTGPLVAMLQLALAGGSEDSADELLAAVIDVIDAEDPVKHPEHTQATDRWLESQGGAWGQRGEGEGPVGQTLPSLRGREWAKKSRLWSTLAGTIPRAG